MVGTYNKPALTSTCHIWRQSLRIYQYVPYYCYRSIWTEHSLLHQISQGQSRCFEATKCLSGIFSAAKESHMPHAPMPSMRQVPLPPTMTASHATASSSSSLDPLSPSEHGNTGLSLSHSLPPHSLHESLVKHHLGQPHTLENLAQSESESEEHLSDYDGAVLPLTASLLFGLSHMVPELIITDTTRTASSVNSPLTSRFYNRHIPS